MTKTDQQLIRIALLYIISCDLPQLSIMSELTVLNLVFWSLGFICDLYFGAWCF